MVGGLKVLRVQAGSEREFEQLFRELRAQMHDHEPGCILFALLRSRTDPRTYIVHEQYQDQAALDAHERSAHGARYFPQIRAILESITVEYFDGVVE